jgi:hypothetical protein
MLPFGATFKGPDIPEEVRLWATNIGAPVTDAVSLKSAVGLSVSLDKFGLRNKRPSSRL